MPNPPNAATYNSKPERRICPRRLVDMSPSLGSINQNFWASSDAFVVPMAPDYFSAMALRSLASVLPRWMAWSNQAANDEGLTDSAYPWKKGIPKYLGSIVQNYRIRRRDGKEAAPTKAYQNWFDELRDAKKSSLIPSLQNSGMLFDEAVYKESSLSSLDFLMEVPDFNSLVATSQEFSKPVFTLTDVELGSAGYVLENQIKSRDRFHQIYNEGASKIMVLSDYV